MQVEEMTVEEIRAKYGDPAKLLTRRRGLGRVPGRRKHKAGPNKTEQTVYRTIIEPMLEAGQASKVMHGDEYGRVRLGSRTTYRPDWVVWLTTGQRLYMECKKRWARAKSKNNSTWRTRETLVKLNWLAAKRRRCQVWLVTVEEGGEVTREHITP